MPATRARLWRTLVNVIMKSGKKNLAQRIVYGAFEKVSEKARKG
jgi:small subunit ribosomal protein S7